MKEVLVFGTFNTIHPGHLFLINEAKKHGQVHAVLALDSTIRKVKGRPPVHAIHERVRQLEAYEVKAFPGDEHDRLKVFRELRPDSVMLGYDQKLFVDTLTSYIAEQELSTKVIAVPSFHADIFASRKSRAVAEDSDAGFLLIDKPAGEPSFHTVSQLRKITGIKQIGFAGTLDPLASGLLACGISKACGLLDWWHFFPKTYEATAELGATSSTYDSEGEVTRKRHAPPTREEVARVLRQFTGTIEQIPPMFSAKKVGGQRLYQIARRGRSVERKASSVTIHSIELLSYEQPHLTFSLVCSTGTYVRSLVHDIGTMLKTGAVMTGLRRTEIGPYSVRDALRASELSAASWKDHLISAQDLQSQLIAFLYLEPDRSPRLLRG